MKKLNKAMSVAVAAVMMVSLGSCGNSADAAKHQVYHDEAR